MNKPSSGSSIWFLPVVCVVLGVAVSVGSIAIDRAFGNDVIPRWMTGGPDAALGVLTTIAASMVSLATLVLTITMVVVQLAMAQFSPRIVQTFLRDRPSQLAIGLFVGTFAHAMLAMREIDVDADRVPGIAIAVGYLLVIVSIAMLVIYVDHIGRSLRVSALLELVGDDTRRLLDERYPDSTPSPEPDPHAIVADTSGVVIAIDRDALVRLASDTDVVLHLVTPVGSYVPAGAAMLRIEGDGPGQHRLDRAAAAEAISLGLERSLDEDVAYGFRMIVDVAERALSDSPFLDPTTAVQAVDRLHDGLRQLATRVIPDGTHRDPSGTVRFVEPVMTWEAFVHLALDEVRLAGAASPQVSRRLTAALHDLIAVAPPERRPVLEEQLHLLQDAVRDSGRSARDVELAMVPDQQGIGVAATNACETDDHDR